MEKATRRILCTHTCEGRRHDFRLFKASKVRLKKETQGIYDSGYQGAQRTHANTLLPIKKPRGGKLTKEQKKANKALAQQRVANENVIGLLKRFHIIADKYRNRRKRFGLRVTLIAAIHNFELQ